jgi:hypothetical protein
VVNKYNLCSIARTVEGLTTIPLASTRYVSEGPRLALGQPSTPVLAGFGKTVVDTSPDSPYRHRIYIPAMDCGPLSLGQQINRALGSSSNCPVGNSIVYALVGTQGGTRWTLQTVAKGTNRAVPIWPDTVATDASGTVYLTWHDNHYAFLDVSQNGGQTWTAPSRINPPAIPTAVYATVAAGPHGVIKVAFYGTTVAGDANDSTVMGIPEAPGAAQWRVYLASSSDGGHTFATSPASPIVDTGALCTRGDACSAANTRDLFDNFGMVLIPSSSAVAIDYTSDQPDGDLAHDFAAYATEVGR